MAPGVKPPTQAEIEEALKAQRASRMNSNPTPISMPPTSPAPSVFPQKTVAEKTLEGNSEINDALKQFEKEQGNVAVPKYNQTVDVMSSQRIEIPVKEGAFKMEDKVIKWSGGIIKDQKQATYFLLCTAIIFMLISLYFFFGPPKFNSGAGIKKVDYMLQPELDPSSHKK